MKNTKPEASYRTLTDPSARRRAQAAVVGANREHVESLVRRLVANPKHRAEAEQVGAIGLLVALEKHDPTSRVPFRRLALQCAKAELALWQKNGLAWKKSA